MAVNKTVYQSIVDKLLVELSTKDTALSLAQRLAAFAKGFDKVGQLSKDQKQELAAATERLAELQSVIMPAIGQSAWDKLMADPNAPQDTVQGVKAKIARLSGNHDMMRRQYLSDTIPSLLAIPNTVPTMVNASGVFCLGNKTKSKSASGKSRASVSAVKTGQILFWYYQKNWYQFTGTEQGIRIHCLTSRTELTADSADSLPKSPSAAKKILTGTWGDNRGFVSELPKDCGVTAMTG